MIGYCASVLDRRVGVGKVKGVLMEMWRVNWLVAVSLPSWYSTLYRAPLYSVRGRIYGTFVLRGLIVCSV